MTFSGDPFSTDAFSDIAGAQRSQSLAASSTPVSSLVRGRALLLASTTPASLLKRAIAALRLASTSPVSTLLFNVARGLLATTTPVSLIVKAVGKLVSVATTTPVSLIVKAVGKIIGFRTNLLPHSDMSESAALGVVGSGGVITANAGIGFQQPGVTLTVTGFGKEDGLGYTEVNFSGSSPSGGSTGIAFDTGAVVISPASGTPYIWSIFTKLVSGTRNSENLNFTTGGGSGSAFTSTTTRTRQWMNGTTTGTGNTFFYYVVSFQTGVPCNFTIRFYATMVEIGTGAPGAYLLTGSSSASGATVGAFVGGYLARGTSVPLSSTITMVGSISRAIAKGAVGSAQAVASLARAVTRSFPAVASAVASIVRAVAKHVAGATTGPSSALVRSVLHAARGTASQASSLLRGRVIVVSQTPVGFMVRSLSRFIADVTTEAGILYFTVVYYVTAASAGAVGSLVRQTGKIALGTASQVISILRGLPRIYTLNATGLLFRGVTRTLVQSTSPVGLFSRVGALARSLLAATSPVAMTVRAMVVIRSGQVLAQALRATVLTKIAAGATTPVALFVRKAAKGLLNTTTPVGSILLVRQFVRGFLNQTSAVATLAKQLARTFQGVVAPVALLTRQMVAVRSAAVSVTGLLQRALARSISWQTTPTGQTSKSLLRPLLGSTSPVSTLLRATGALFAAVAQTVSTGLHMLSAVRRASTVPVALLGTAKTHPLALAGTASAVGSLGRSVLRALLGVAQGQATQAHMTGRALLAQTQAQGLLTRSLARGLLMTTVPAAFVARRVVRSLPLSVLPQGTLRRTMVLHTLFAVTTPVAIGVAVWMHLYRGVLTMYARVVRRWHA